MRAAHRDGQGVDAGGGHESGRFGGVGANPGGVRAVLAADLTQFGFQGQAALMRPVRGRSGGGCG